MSKSQQARLEALNKLRVKQGKEESNQNAQSNYQKTKKGKVK